MMLLILKSIFEDQIGITNIDNAQNGLEAYHKATQNSFNIIIMDLNMPVMDGFETAQKIRQYYLESQMYFQSEMAFQVETLPETVQQH